MRVRQKHGVHQHSSARVQQIPVAASATQLEDWLDNGPEGLDSETIAENISQRPKEARPHPIEQLIHRAETAFKETLEKESHGLKEAAKAYRRRRGRHPPPGFDRWYRFAEERHVVMIENFWDTIYDDLHPFWAVSAQHMRKVTSEFEMKISVRNGHATTKSTWFWTTMWFDLIATIESLLPDMDIPLNAMDEPRVVVPWDEMRNHVAEADRTVRMPQPENVTGEFQRLGPPELNDSKSADKGWGTEGEAFKARCLNRTSANVAERRQDHIGTNCGSDVRRRHHRGWPRHKPTLPFCHTSLRGTVRNTWSEALCQIRLFPVISAISLI